MVKRTEDTARGIKELWKRYCRRADYLAQDDEYRGALGAFSRSWNDSFPGYRLTRVEHSSNVTLSGMPPALHRDVGERMRVRGEKLAANRWAVVPPDPVDNAVAAWMVGVGGLVVAAFPPEDFPSPYPFIAHPAIMFVSTCLYMDPFLVDPEQAIREFQLLPTALVESPRAEPTLAHLLTGEPDVFWYLPLYPGMIITDLRSPAGDRY